MTASKVSSKKWISEENVDEVDIFNHCSEMGIVCFAITKVILEADNKWKGSEGKNNSYNHSFTNRKYIMELVNIRVGNI